MNAHKPKSCIERFDHTVADIDERGVYLRTIPCSGTNTDDSKSAASKNDPVHVICFVLKKKLCLNTAELKTLGEHRVCPRAGLKITRG